MTSISDDPDGMNPIDPDDPNPETPSRFIPCPVCRGYGELDPSQTEDPLVKLTRALKEATSHLSHANARFLVDFYYTAQRNRIRAKGQERSQADDEPDLVIEWLTENSRRFEDFIKRALDSYSNMHPAGVWAKSITGIGPVLAAGLVCHIDIKTAVTAGNIWRFAGLDPTDQWLGSEKARELVTEVMDGTETLTDAHIETLAERTQNRPESLIYWATDGGKKPLTRHTIIQAIARRPWNAKLKTLTWKIGESFVKVSNHQNDIYGHVYAERKALEIARNERGNFSDQAESILRNKRIGHDTDAYKSYSQGQLPPAHIHARAKRYAVKLFLAHYHHVAYLSEFGTSPPKPYVLSLPGHSHFIEPPNLEIISSHKER